MSLLFYKSDTVTAGLQMKPGLSDHVRFLHRSDIGRSAVLTVVGIISDAEIFLVAKHQFIFCDTRIQNFLRYPLALLSVYVQRSVRDSHLISRHCHNTFDIIMRIFIAVGQKRYNIPGFGRR